ncbi:hypothetical protein ACHQM5_021993 [Ranunculus cassubicifolius]
MTSLVLPDDLVLSILLWLPVSSLLRFKSVCKSWFNLIQTPSFIYHHLHLHHHSNNSNYKAFAFNPLGSLSYGLPTLCLFSPHNFDFDIPPLFLHIDSPVSLFHNLDILTCNGLICIHFTDKHFVDNKYVSLWNPATKQLKHLPQSPFQHPPLNVCPITVVGFGFHTNPNDFKLVRIISFFPAFPGVNHVETYSLLTNSWTSLDSVVLPVDFILPDCDPKAPYRNGIYCWLGRKGPVVFGDDRVLLSNNIILWFDFTKEEFGTMPLPDVDSVKSCTLPNICIVRDNLACMNTAGDPLHFEIWVLNEFGVQQSWSRLHKVEPFSMSNLIGISKDGNYLLFAMDFQQLGRYHLVTQQVTTLSVHKDLFRTRIINACTLYKESLVLLE